MKRTHGWSRHYQQGWEEKAADPSLPLWLRVACLAYGRHKANGHALFTPGAVALCLAEVDRTTGVVTPPPRQHVHRAIATAVAHGWLAEGSGSRCLVVPAHQITGGLGNEYADCPQHRRPTKRRHHSVGTSRTEER